MKLIFLIMRIEMVLDRQEGLNCLSSYPHRKEHKNQMQIINWDDYFMSVAYISSLRSKDPRTQVGACIVDKNHRIISTGYNGMPNNCNDSEMPWESKEGLEGKYLYVVHSELNAILYAKNDLNGCILYSTLFPCNECSKTIVQSGISEVVYLSDKYKDMEQTIASRFILNMAGVKYRQLISDCKIEIKLNNGE